MVCVVSDILDKVHEVSIGLAWFLDVDTARLARGYRVMKSGMLLRTSILIFLFTLPGFTICAAERPPNIVFILADDMTYTDSGCYGNGQVRTPNIDKLAAEGMRFTQCYSGVAMCSPARQMIYTGLFPVRNGAYPQRSRIHDGVKTLPVYMKELGYRVAIAGKQHYGPVEAYPFEVISGEPLDFSRFGEFMGRDREQPFCLVVCSNEPHTPWDRGAPDSYDAATLKLPPYFVDTPRTRDLMRHYYAEIEYFDGQVGKTLELLEASGQAENTLVMFASEQGAAVPFAKWTLYDAGIRAQLIARWPGKIQPGTTTDAMVQYCDLVPTWIESGGGEAPDELDGKSLLPVLRGTATGLRSEIYAEHTNLGVNKGNPYAIRAIRTGKYKLIWNLMHGEDYHNNLTELDRKWFFFNSWREVATTDPTAKVLVARYLRRPEFELYDMEGDPFELHNIATEHETTVKELHGRLQRWMTAQGDNGIEAERAALSRSAKGGSGEE